MGLRSAKRGASGPDVKAVQQGLNKYYKAAVLVEDGVFGPATERVVRQFQAETQVLAVDGIVGPATRSALFPLVGVTINFWGRRSRGTAAGQNLTLGLPRLTIGSTPHDDLSLLPRGFLARPVQNDFLQLPGLPDAVPTPRVITPLAGKLVVDWQQLVQTQVQFDGLFKNQQNSFAIGLQSVFKRRHLDPNQHHLEIATGCLLQSPIGFQDGHKNDFTIACFAQATWVESLGRSGNFQWAPYVQVQGQGNPTGPPTPIGSVAAFPLNFNLDLGNDITLQLGSGVIESLKFTPQGVKSVFGPQFGLGLQGRISILE